MHHHMQYILPGIGNSIVPGPGTLVPGPSWKNASEGISRMEPIRDAIYAAFTPSSNQPLEWRVIRSAYEGSLQSLEAFCKDPRTSMRRVNIATESGIALLSSQQHRDQCGYLLPLDTLIWEFMNDMDWSEHYVHMPHGPEPKVRNMVLLNSKDRPSNLAAFLRCDYPVIDMTLYAIAVQTKRDRQRSLVHEVFLVYRDGEIFGYACKGKAHRQWELVSVPSVVADGIERLTDEQKVALDFNGLKKIVNDQTNSYEWTPSGIRFLPLSLYRGARHYLASFPALRKLWHQLAGINRRQQ